MGSMPEPTVRVPAGTLIDLMESLSGAVDALAKVSSAIDTMMPDQGRRPASASAPVVDLTAYRRTRGGAA
ncbi:hypothetical protein [Nonomuraea guangzhouensis]|uniref:Uncharacterized protein n=1 Tax=Nonomuraea guangzhouensis TaxID=1291555 RepID=A0ABW4GZC2_9ACTN|nr:hypothetical protein [Nonomuraea guangzhouensis]